MNVDATNCPGCRIRVEKDGGCNAMYCRNCGMHWCWLCRVDIDACGRGGYEHFDWKKTLFGCGGQ